MAFRFEFDPVNKILLARFEGEVTNEAAAEYHDALGRNWIATGPARAFGTFQSPPTLLWAPSFFAVWPCAN